MLILYIQLPIYNHALRSEVITHRNSHTRGYSEIQVQFPVVVKQLLAVITELKKEFRSECWSVVLIHGNGQIFFGKFGGQKTDFGVFFSQTLQVHTDKTIQWEYLRKYLHATTTSLPHRLQENQTISFNKQRVKAKKAEHISHKSVLDQVENNRNDTFLSSWAHPLLLYPFPYPQQFEVSVEFSTGYWLSEPPYCGPPCTKGYL